MNSAPPSSVKKSVRALLYQAVDYAGLFPPAALDMPTVARNYAAYRRAETAWLLGRLIVPTARLDEFADSATDLLGKALEAAMTEGGDDTTENPPPASRKRKTGSR